MFSTFKISKKVYPEKLENLIRSGIKSHERIIWKLCWYSQIQNSDWVKQRKVVNSELIRPLLKMKGYGWPKSPRVSDFRPKSGQFWYFLASPLLCRLRLPSGANASTKILPILHLYTNVLLSVKRAKNLACLNLLMFATQKILSHPSPLFWLSQKIEVRRRRKSNILHPQPSV